MAVLGFPIAFALGFFGLSWWTVIIPTVISIIGVAQAQPARVGRLQPGNPIMFAWMALPFLGLWWLGSYVGGY
jgi:hypothetical protein